MTDEEKIEALDAALKAYCLEADSKGNREICAARQNVAVLLARQTAIVGDELMMPFSPEACDLLGALANNGFIMGYLSAKYPHVLAVDKDAEEVEPKKTAIPPAILKAFEPPKEASK